MPDRVREGMNPSPTLESLNPLNPHAPWGHPRNMKILGRGGFSLPVWATKVAPALN